MGMVKDFVKYIKEDSRRAIVEAVLEEFTLDVKPAMDGGLLRRGINQNDANDANIIVRPRYGVEMSDIKTGDQVEIEGLIDFGDMVRTFTVCEPAIAVAYMMIT